MSTTAQLIPTAKEAIAGAKDLGMVTAGMIAAHALVTATKKDTAIVNGGIAIVGFGVCIKAKNPIIKMAALGAAAYGTIKLINHGVKAVATPQSVEGLNGILPEKAKEYIRKFIPTLSGMDGSDNDSDDVRGVDDVIKNLSLDEDTMRNESSSYSGYTEQEAIAGLGEVVDLAA